MKPFKAALVIAGIVFAPQASWAGEADVVGVQARQTSGGTYRFDVTVAHADKGWDHYADAFEILSSDGTVLGTRILAHPHETEQPFTRALGNVRIPKGTKQVTVRAHDKIHGLGGKTMRVTLP